MDQTSWNYFLFKAGDYTNDLVPHFLNLTKNSIFHIKLNISIWCSLTYIYWKTRSGLLIIEEVSATFVTKIPILFCLNLKYLLFIAVFTQKHQKSQKKSNVKCAVNEVLELCLIGVGTLNKYWELNFCPNYKSFVSSVLYDPTVFQIKYSKKYGGLLLKCPLT